MFADPVALLAHKPALATRGKALWVLAGAGASRTMVGELRVVVGMLCKASMRLEVAVPSCECDGDRGSFCVLFADWLFETVTALRDQLDDRRLLEVVAQEYVSECQTVLRVLVTAMGPISRRLGMRDQPPEDETVPASS